MYQQKQTQWDSIQTALLSQAISQTYLNQPNTELIIDQSFIPILCLSFSYPTQIMECDYDNEKQPIRPLLHYYTALVTIARLYDFVNQFFPEIKDHVYFHSFPAYQRYSLPRTIFAILSQCIAPKTLEKLFAIKGDVISEEREQKDLIHGLLGYYNAYVGRHLVSTFMLSQAHTLRLGSAFTESQFHASSSTLLHYLRQNSPEIENKIRSTTLSLIEILLSQDPNCNNWNDTDLHLSDFESIKAQLANQFSNLPSESKIYAQIGIPTHASYLKHPGECSLRELVTNRCYLADFLKQENRNIEIYLKPTSEMQTP